MICWCRYEQCRVPRIQYVRFADPWISRSSRSMSSMPVDFSSWSWGLEKGSSFSSVTTRESPSSVVLRSPRRSARGAA
mgnify:CR=1 FL=1